MCRNFEVQVEVFPCAEHEQVSIAARLREWGMSIEDQADWLSDERGDGCAFWGSIQLWGGETESGEHQKLADSFPDLWIHTCWRYLDVLPWDKDFESEPVNTHSSTIPTVHPIP